MEKRKTSDLKIGDASVRLRLGASQLLLIATAPVLFGQPTPSAAPPPNPYTMRVVYKLPGTEQVRIREAIKFGETEGHELFTDVYQPADLKENEKRAAVIFISGGEKVRDWPAYRDYGRLAAAQGLIALVPDKRFPRGPEGIVQGTADTETLLKFIADEGETVGIDPERLAFWIFSGGGQLTGVGLRPQTKDGPPRPKCIVTFYAVSDFWPDLIKANPGVAEYSPAHVLATIGVEAPPIFVARAGQDTPILNESIAAFVSAGLRSNAPLTLVNYPDGKHGFDCLSDTDESRAIIKAAFNFILFYTKAR